MVINNRVWIATRNAAAEALEPLTPGPYGIVHLAWISGGTDVTISPAIGLHHTTHLARHPYVARIYATEQQADGRIDTLAVAGDTLQLVSTVSSAGALPCHLHVHPDGRWLYATNYGDGVLTTFALDRVGNPERVSSLTQPGSSVDPQRQSSSHPHATMISPGGGFLIVCDLGADVLYAYRLTDGGLDHEVRITPLPSGSGPRHMVADHDHLYVAGELNGNVVIVDWHEDTGFGTVRGSVRATSGGCRAPRSYHRSSCIAILPASGCSSVPGARTQSAFWRSTAAWPSHLVIIGDDLIIAGTRDNAVAAHHLDPELPGGLSPVTWSAGAAPYCTLVRS